MLVLDSLEDPQNVGTLLRSAEAAGVHGIIFPTRRQAPLSPAAVKASAGAVEHLLLCPVDDLAGRAGRPPRHGLRIAGSEADAPLTARQTDLRGPLAIVVGSEGQGLGPAVRRRCDLFMRIPMRGSIGSLNAAVAGSVLLFEAVAQRDPDGRPEPRPSAVEPRRRRPAGRATRRRRRSLTETTEPAEAALAEPPETEPTSRRASAPKPPEDRQARRLEADEGALREGPSDHHRPTRDRCRRARRRPAPGRSERQPTRPNRTTRRRPTAARLTHRTGRPYHSPAPMGSSAV